MGTNVKFVKFLSNKVLKTIQKVENMMYLYIDKRYANI